MNTRLLHTRTKLVRARQCYVWQHCEVHGFEVWILHNMCPHVSNVQWVLSCYKIDLHGNCCLKKKIYIYCLISPYFKSWHCEAKNNTETSKQRKNNLWNYSGLVFFHFNTFVFITFICNTMLKGRKGRIFSIRVRSQKNVQKNVHSLHCHVLYFYCC